MKLTDYLVSLIRTWVPVAVGSVLGWASGVTWLHPLIVNLSPEQRLSVTTAVTGVLIAAYYGLVRLGETKWPALGKLLGKQVPTVSYTKPATVTTSDFTNVTLRAGVVNEPAVIAGPAVVAPSVPTLAYPEPASSTTEDALPSGQPPTP